MAVKGVKVESKLDEINQQADQQIIKALKTIGLKAESYAKKSLTEQHAVDTGRLRNSVTHDVDTEEMAVYVGTNVEYAPYIEFGTYGGKRMKPRPYIRPSIENHMDEYRQIIEKALK